MQLGLCNPPEPVYLYVRASEDKSSACWYKYNMDTQQQIAVQERAVTGYIQEVRLTTKEYKGKENIKLDVLISADEIYVIRTGIETNFAKTFLLAIAEVQDLTKPLIVSCQPGQENVVFCRVYDAETKARIKAEWKDANWAQIITDTQSRLGNKSATAVVANQPSWENQTTIDRGMVFQEIDSLIRRKNISTEDARAYAIQWTGRQSRSQMSDSQLIDFRDRLSRILP
jgi:hypothetical protein